MAYLNSHDLLSAIASLEAGETETALTVLRTARDHVADPALIEAARSEYCIGSDDDIEIDDEYVGISEGEDGRFVCAWVWMPYADDGEEEEDDDDN